MVQNSKQIAIRLRNPEEVAGHVPRGSFRGIFVSLHAPLRTPRGVLKEIGAVLAFAPHSGVLGLEAEMSRHAKLQISRRLRAGLVSRPLVACLLWTCRVGVISQEVEWYGPTRPKELFDPLATPNSMGLKGSARRAWDTPAARAERARRRHALHPIRDVVYPGGEACIPSPLWEKEVDTMTFELGCGEIQVSRTAAHRKGYILI